MTEYGRGQGSEPWHPDDPLYGDGGWGGQQTQQASGGQWGGNQPAANSQGWGNGPTGSDQQPPF